MGEFFKEEKRIEERKEEKLITDPQELFMVYNVLTNKIQMMTNEGYETIMPIRAELTGTKQTPDDTGQIGHLRRRIESSRIARMDIGIMMWSALKNIEDLDRWSERYIKYLEDYLDAMQHIARSSFKIISNLHARINGMQAIIDKLETRRGVGREIPKKEIPIEKMLLPRKIPSGRYAAPAEDIPATKEEPIEEPPSEESPGQDAPPDKTDDITTNNNENDIPEENAPFPPKPEFVEPPMAEKITDEPPQIDIFNELIDQKIEEYRAARETGEENKIEAGRRQLYELCGRDKGLKKRIKDLIIRLDMEPSA